MRCWSGVVVGRGRTGLVLAHGRGGDLCEWLGYAQGFAERGSGAFWAVNAWAAMPRLRVPVLFVTADDDEPFLDAARAMYRRARSADKRLLVAVRRFVADQTRR